MLAACSGAPEPREVRLDRGLGERLGIAPATVEGVFGAELTLEEIRRLHVEPRCASTGLVMTSLRVSRRADGAQEVTARCGLAFAAPAARRGPARP